MSDGGSRHPVKCGMMVAEKTALIAVGQSLPVLPLALRNAGVVPVDFEATYREACRRSRLEDSIRSPIAASR